MSHFVFGLIEGTAASQRRQDIIQAAQASGIALAVDEAITQPILAKMTGTPPVGAVRFLLTASVGDDNSDALVSPYLIGSKAAVSALSLIDEWVRKVCDLDGVDRIRLWMTEGFDINFHHLSLRPGRLAETVGPMVLAEDYLPSTRVTFDCETT